VFVPSLFGYGPAVVHQRNRRFRTAHLWQVVSALVVLCLGGLIVSSKLGAKAQAAPLGAPLVLAVKGGALPAQPAGNASALPALAAANPPPIPTASVAAAGSAAPLPGAAAATGEEASGDKDDISNLTLGGAVIQDESDVPPGLSPEQLDSLGNGKVPIHRDGKFRSPLANPTSGGPATVKVGLVISEIRDYQITDGSFLGRFFLVAHGGQALAQAAPSVHQRARSQLLEPDRRRDLPFYRCTGSFTSPVDLRNYPFDTQYLDINVEDAVYGVDTVVFVSDPRRTSLDATFRLSGYGVASVGATAIKHQYPSRFDRDDLYVSRYKFTLGLDRFAQSAAFSVYVPAFIIVLISLIGLWVPPDELEVRSSAGAPMLAAAVLFHYSLIQSLPATGYLTHADKLMLGVYVSLLITWPPPGCS